MPDLLDAMDDELVWEHMRRCLNELHQRETDPELVEDIELMQFYYSHAAVTREQRVKGSLDEYRKRWEERYGDI